MWLIYGYWHLLRLLTHYYVIGGVFMCLCVFRRLVGLSIASQVTATLTVWNRFN